MNDPASSIDSASFREAMSRVAEQVHIVATDGPAGRAGATVTAVASVSDAPPSLLVCLNRASSTLERIRANGRFSVNVISETERAIAEIFSGGGGVQGAERFRPGDGWRVVEGSPLLDSALSAFACRVTDMTPVGSHVVIFGAVEAVSSRDDGPTPLLYHRRGYRSL